MKVYILVHDVYHGYVTVVDVFTDVDRADAALRGIVDLIDSDEERRNYEIIEKETV